MALTQSFEPMLLSREMGTVRRFETTVGEMATTLTEASVAVGSTIQVFHRVVTSDGVNETEGPMLEMRLFRGTLVSVDEADVPVSFAVQGNYPNPFNPETTLLIDMPEPGRVEVLIFDLLGREVKRLEAGRVSPGSGRSVRVSLSELPSGVYVYQVVVRLERGGMEMASGRMTLLK